MPTPAGHLHPVTTANTPGLQRGRLSWASMEDDMPSTLIPACVLCRLRLASRLLPGLHIREDHLRRNRHAEPGHDHSGDRGGPAGETGSAAGGGPDAQAARVPGISPNTARAAPAVMARRGMCAARRGRWPMRSSRGPGPTGCRPGGGGSPGSTALRCPRRSVVMAVENRHRQRGPGRRAGLPDPDAESATGSVADEVEPRAWPYRLPAGWRRITELDRPAVSAQKCRDGRQDRHRLPGPARRAA